MRTHLYAEPAGRFLHEAILEACNKFGSQTALVDLSALDANGAPKRISYSELGEAIVSAPAPRKGLVSVTVSAVIW